jgi:hypothetical protein
MSYFLTNTNMTKIKASQRKGKGGLAALTAGQKQEELALMASSGAMAQGGHFARESNNSFAAIDAQYELARESGNAFAAVDAQYELARESGNAFAAVDAQYELARESGNAFAAVDAQYDIARESSSTSIA